MGICNDETYLCIVHYRVDMLLCVLTRDVVASHSGVNGETNGDCNEERV
jgi:hypothetical protein